MQETEKIYPDVDKILSEQRDESDARSIINEIERVYTLEGKHQYRWVWELLQNARDEAGEGVDVKLELHPNTFTFAHNGKPFTSHHLLALLRKTSTKPLNGSAENTGKFGTGFVTSHLLSKNVSIQGVHQNSKGKRRFELTVDRKPDTLEAMKKAIAIGIQKVREIDSCEAQNGIDFVNTFEYELKGNSYQVALGGLNQLRDNLAFTLLTNKQIKTIEIIEGDKQEKYSCERKESNGEIQFAWLRDKYKTEDTTGLLFLERGNIIIASPARELNGKYVLSPIASRARLFKDLPLIGTEEFYIPTILQHRGFQPTEPRDGLRTRMSSETGEDEDHIAKINRDALEDFVKIFSAYLNALISIDVQNLHLLAESGIPPNADAYYDKSWYQEHIQKPIRSAILSHDLVNTVSGSNISVLQAKFTKCEGQHAEEMYKLLSRWYPDKCPDENTYKDWSRIIEMETDNWPEGICVTADELVREVSEKATIDAFDMKVEQAIAWLQDLVLFLENSGLERLGHDKAIYPNQDKKLVVQTDIFHDLSLNKRFKSISNGMGRRLEAELLPPYFKAKYVEPFDVKGFLNSLNKEIGSLSLKVENASTEQIQAIMHLCCTFRSDKAERREQWYDLIHVLLPKLAPEKVTLDFDEEYQWEPSEKCALKYVCHLIQSSVNIEEFSKQYFDSNKENALKWLDDLYDFVFRNEDNKAAALVYKIIPTQDGLFKKYTEDIFREDNPSRFDNLIKSLYHEFTNKGDPKIFLVDKGITNSNIRETSIHKLTRTIDELFNDRDSEDKVHEGGKYHRLFLSLKDWIDQQPGNAADEYFPIFSKKQPVLYLKAFGGDTFSRLLKIQKPVEELEKLAQIRLSASDMQKLDNAVAELGSTDQLLQKAEEMIEFADFVRWRQEVGKAAEEAFLEAIAQADSKFLNPENPDDGKDFVIKLNGKEYSIELKSAVEGKETVKMSLKQGELASDEREHYALCVISRPSRQLTNKEQFIERAKFVIDIGQQIGDKVKKWKTGLNELEINEDVSVELDSKTGGVNIRKRVWSCGLSFQEFVEILKKHFEIE